MPSTLTKPDPQQRDAAVTSRIMAAVRGRDTKPELALRRALHARGLRYRVHPRDVPGHPDLVNRQRKIAVFVDGDFWHGNPKEWKRRGFDSMEAQFPERKRALWTTKLKRNVQRDREVDATLTAAGWQVLRFWESEIQTNLDAIAAQIIESWASGEPRRSVSRASSKSPLLEH
jgi:DNA mismatch endonuclease, patch repair protein